MLSYSANYRSKLNFTWEGLEAAQQSLLKIRQQAQELMAVEADKQSNLYTERFEQSLADDLNIPTAMAVLWEVLKSDLPSGQKRAFLEQADQILSLNLFKEDEVLQIPEPVQRLVQEREELRKAKKWAEADALREKIEAAGFVINDSNKEGDPVVKAIGAIKGLDK